MSFKDKNNIEVFPNDRVVCNGITYVVKSIESYPTATIAVLENVRTHEIDRLFLRDIVKL